MSQCLADPLQAEIQNDLTIKDSAVLQLPQEKQSAEQEVVKLLKKGKAAAERKLELCEERHRQKELMTSLDLTDSNLPPTKDSPSAPQDGSASASAADCDNVESSNEKQLSACKRVLLAFKATKAAHLELQKCLAAEEKLLHELQGPLQEAAAQTRQLINRTAEQFRNSEPRREQRHAEMLIR